MYLQRKEFFGFRQFNVLSDTGFATKGKRTMRVRQVIFFFYFFFFRSYVNSQQKHCNKISEFPIFFFDIKYYKLYCNNG